MVQSAQKIISVTQGERSFITFLVNFVVTTSPGDLLTNLEPNYFSFVWITDYKRHIFFQCLFM